MLVASGVEFISGFDTFTANATKEVVISAGVFQTPHLLELSGKVVYLYMSSVTLLILLA